MSRQRLGVYTNSWFDRGRPVWVEVLWLLLGLLVASSIPGSQMRTALLRLFGARIGDGVVFKPRIVIKFPWKLAIGDNTWIGEGVWLDNVDQITIGSDCCLSQGVYVCTGNHDWSKETFDLVIQPVTVNAGAWLGAFARIGPGVTIGEDAVVAMGAVALEDVADNAVVQGNPATTLRQRFRSD